MAFPNKVYCATSALGVYYTDSFVGPEAGLQPTWVAVNDGLPNTLCKQFTVDPHAPEARQFVLLTDGSLHRRENGGAWTEILDAAGTQTLLGLPEGQITAFCCDTLNPGVLYGSVTGSLFGINPHFVKSVDYGATWSGGLVYTSNTGKTRGADVIRAHGDNVYIGWCGRTVVQGLLLYSTDGGGGWASVAGSAISWSPKPLLNPLTPGFVYTDWYRAGGHYDLSCVPPLAILIEDYGLTGTPAMRFHPTDGNRQLMLSGRAVYKTYDGWATIDSGTSGSLPNHTSNICPQWWADDDIIFGHGAARAYAISAIQTITDNTPTPMAGTNYDTPPYTDAIPSNHGGICWDGIQAIVSIPSGGPFPPEDETIQPPGYDSPISIVGGGGSVQGVTMPDYYGDDRGEPLPGDRGAWKTDTPAHAKLHAQDISRETYQYHTNPANPPPRTLGELLDVDTSGATDGDALVCNDGTWGPGDMLTADEHDAIGDNAPHHAPVTLGAGSNPALELSGQELTLTGDMGGVDEDARKLIWMGW